MRRFVFGLALLVLFASCGKPDGFPTSQADVFDPTAISWGKAPASGPAGPVEVVDYGPRGGTTTNWNVGQVKVRFSEFVRAVTAAEKEDATGLIEVRSSGTLVDDGEAYFQTPDLLVWESKGSLPPAHVYDVRVEPFDAVSGARFEEGLEWSFETGRPRVELESPADRARNVPTEPVIFLRVNFDTAAAQIQRRLSVLVGGEPVPAQVTEVDEDDDPRWSGHVLRVALADPFPVGAAVRVRVEEGWVSRAGPLPADESFDGAFQIHPRPGVSLESCGDDVCPIQPVMLEFATPVSADQMKYVSIRPRPANWKVNPWGDDEVQTVYLEASFLPDIDYTLLVDRDLVDVFGQKLGTTFERTLRFSMPPEDLYFQRTGGAVVDDGTARVGISSRHVRTFRVRAARLTPTQWSKLHDADFRPGGPDPETLGEVREKEYRVTYRQPTRWGSTGVDLEDVVGSWRGPLLVEVSPVEMAPGYDPDGLTQRALFQFSSVAAHLFSSTARSFVRAQDLSSGKPLVGSVAAYQGGVRSRLGDTDQDGLLETVGTQELRGVDALVFEDADGEPVILSPHPLASEHKRPLAAGESLAGKIVTERGVYRPGETVFLAAWVAVRTPHDPYGFRAVPRDIQARISVRDREGTEIGSSQQSVAHGKLSAQVELPDGARLGGARVEVSFSTSDGTPYLGKLSGFFRVEEYRVPDFLVDAELDDDELVGDQETRLTIDARHFTGTPVEMADLNVTASCWQVSAPQRDGWSVGKEPRWGGVGVARVKASGTRELAIGQAEERVSNLGDPSGAARSCHLDVSVLSRSFQSEGARASVFVHPADHYLGFRVLEERYEPGADVPVRVAMFDREAEPIEGRGTVRLRVVRSFDKPIYRQRGSRRWVDRYEEILTDLPGCRLTLEGKREAGCTLRNLQEGNYTLEAVSGDDEHVVATTEFWVGTPRWETDEEDEPVPFIRVSAPVEQQSAGDPITVALETEADGYGVVFSERFGLREAFPFRARQKRAKVEIPTDPSWIPTMRLTAVMIDQRGAVPALAVASDDVAFDTATRSLDVSIDAPETAQIRQTIPVKVEVRQDGELVDGRVSVWAVDDAVLRLTNHQLPNVLDSFLPRRIADRTTVGHLASVLPPFVPERYDPYRAGGFGFGLGSGFGRGGGGMGAGAAAGQQAARSNMVTTPLFVGDAAATNGVAVVSFDTPDNMTAFRLVAVASATLHDDAPMRYGRAESLLRIEAPLVARPALPRFVRPGDEPSLAVVVTNPSKAVGTLTVRVSVDGDVVKLRDADSVSHTIDVDGTGRAWRFDFQGVIAAAGSGTVTFDATLKPYKAGGVERRDRVEVTLTSEPERTAVSTVATYGTVDDDRTVGFPIQVPADALPDIGGVEISVTSTILGGLRDATRELVHYPYGCVEQTSSRMLPLVALADLSGFVDATEIPNGQTIDAFVASGIEKLVSMQTNSGGFSYWPGGTPSPYASAYATWVLMLAAQAGHPVSENVTKRALDYLETVTAASDRDHPDLVNDLHDIRRAIAVHVLADAGRDVSAAVDGLFDRRARLPMFSRAFMAMAMHAETPDDPRVETLTRELTNAVTEQPGTAHVVESSRYDLGAFFHSDLRSSAIVLQALTRIAPNHSVVPKMARGLMAKRVGGAWRNTQENAYALVAMAAYARAYEKVEPNFEMKIWSEHALLMEARWEGRSSVSKTARLPMNALKSMAADNPKRLVGLNAQRRGEGRAYYRLAMRYGQEPATAPNIARGIRVARRFRTQAAAPSPRPPATIAAGDVMAIDLEVEVKSLTRFVAIDVPLPAGLEGIDRTLGSPKVLPLSGTYGWWASHIEMHDDRIVVFADVLHPGVRRHTVFVRATTPGIFVFPPTQAEAMYTPEVFGRTAGSRIEVQ